MFRFVPIFHQGAPQYGRQCQLDTPKNNISFLSSLHAEYKYGGANLKLPGFRKRPLYFEMEGVVQLSFNNNNLAQLRPRFYIYYKFSCTQKFDSYRVQAEICRNPTSTLQKACSYTCAEVLIGHTWLPYLSESREQPCTHLYTPILQSNKYRKQEPSTRIIPRKNMCEHVLTNSL